MGNVSLSTALNHYKRKEVQEAMIAVAKNREIVGSFNGEAFSKRPDVLQYPNDIIEQVKQGVTSFHMSEEHWSNVQRLSPMLKRQDIDALRSGWDLVIDIDCKDLEYSRFAGYFLVEALKQHNIKNISVKFSGNHGFHIAVPFEAFPTSINNKPIRLLFPEAPRVIANYLKGFTSKYLAKKILEFEDLDAVAKRFDKKTEELIKNKIFDPWNIISLDTVLLASRHLYRMPYSLNEKSGLVSLPINPDKILEFDKKDAEPKDLKISEFKFLDAAKIVHGEATQLILQAYDYNTRHPIEASQLLSDPNKIFSVLKSGEQKNFEELTAAIPEDFFPPCMKIILNGMQDGRKRALFILVNFLSSCGYGYEKIEEILYAWNKKNPEEMREVYLVGQLRYHKQQNKKILPPNCPHTGTIYYKDIGVCQPDNLCMTIKNPVQYAKKKAWLVNREKKEDSAINTGKWNDERKEKMKKVREERKMFKEEVKRKKNAGELE